MGRPVEPLYADEKADMEKVLEGRFSVLNHHNVNINDVNITSDGRRVLVSLRERAILLDGEGKLLWENNFDQYQVSTVFSCCGAVMASGDETGKVSIFIDNRLVVEKNIGFPVSKMDISDDGSRIMVMSNGSQEEVGNTVMLMDQQGRILWSEEIFGLISAEIESKGEKCLLQVVQDGIYKIILYGSQGELLWQKEGFQVAQLSDDGRYITALADKSIYLFSSDGEMLWNRDLDLPVTQIELSQNNRYILAYNHFGGGSDNLFYLDIEGNLLWKQKIRDDSVVALSADGQRVVVTSWRHYSEDLTLVSVFDVRGRLRREIEAGSRAVKIALSDDGGFLVLGCDDGNIYVLNLNRETVGEYVANEKEEVVYYTSADRRESLEENGTRINLFFYDENALVFIPVTRDVKKANNLLRTALEELVKGPKERSYLMRTLPKGIDVGIDIDGGTVLVDLPQELEKITGSTRSMGIIQSILHTAFQFPTVHNIRFLVEGQESDFFGDPEVYIGGEFSRSMVNKQTPLLYIPYRSGFRYYLVPWEIQPSLDSINPAYFLSQKYFQEAGSFIPCNVEIIDAQINGDMITLDLSRNFLSLFESPEDPQLSARAQVVIDGLIITLTSNIKQNKVQFLVEGETITPRGFGYLVEPQETPIYINPEE
ncbi:GerMN domain-containing protein [Candidatus Contubernalis alkaliaceticus]|uniref:GerMN domain-containing protein n=1 Tax=Candidatus Contubernalis alkaliaceticus TaxID=338645 RepID=UPI001F4C4A55|nr:GerMN domain-containing protein [Candidatus Contubernalis alkalaceticus]UNC90635.1 GerMN domain-containing protein [Candidatus Contubernalis alkalaceticus]